MKFIRSIITLFAASSVYSYGIYKRDSSDYNVSAECHKDLDAVEEFKCIGSESVFNVDTYKKICPYLLSEKCTKFFEDPMSYFPNCKNEKDLKFLTTKSGINLTKTFNELSCATDGNGELCPASKASLEGSEINEKRVRETCKSKRCINSLNKMFDSLINKTEELADNDLIDGKDNDDDVMPYLKEILNDASCTSQAIDDTNTNPSYSESGANSSYKLSGSLLLTIAIAFTLF